MGKKMLITTLNHSRTVNLGNYNSVQIGITREFLQPVDEVKETRALVEFVDSELKKRYQEAPTVSENIQKPEPVKPKVSKGNVKTCTYRTDAHPDGCGAEITFKKIDDKWKVYNTDGTAHRCQ